MLPEPARLPLRLPPGSPPRVRDRAAAVAGGLLDLVVSQHCGGCDRPGTHWCPACAQEVAVPPIQASAPVPAWAGAPHDGPAGRAVVAFKDSGQRRLAAPLSALLAAAVAAALDQGPREPRLRAIWLVPVPSRPGARRRRGMDHVAVLAERAAGQLRACGHPAHRLRALSATRDTGDQVGLGRQARLDNVTASMAPARSLLRPSPPAELPAGLIVVVDDVTTTGATLAEAVRALGPDARGRVVAATVTRSMYRPGRGIG